jgi:hypothetical protein
LEQVEPILVAKAVVKAAAESVATVVAGALATAQ